jgi:membrane-associated protease RseP (regulator of RpoE activity)
MRRKRGIYISAGFILMFSALFFFDTSGIVSAIAAAVAIHELGHVAALYALGAKPTLLTAGLGGLSWITPAG